MDHGTTTASTRHFEQAVGDFDADIAATLAAIYRPGDVASAGKVYRSALVSQNGGWFGAAHRAPAIAPDPTLWPAADFDALVEAFRAHGFRPANAWYLNGDVNTAYALEARDGGRLRQPVLFINGEWDALCDIQRSRLGEPMRRACDDLSIMNVPGGHWLPLERKAEIVRAISSWLEMRGLEI